MLVSSSKFFCFLFSRENTRRFCAILTQVKCKHAPADTMVSCLLPFAVKSATFADFSAYLFKKSETYIKKRKYVHLLDRGVLSLQGRDRDLLARRLSNAAAASSAAAAPSIQAAPPLERRLSRRISQQLPQWQQQQGRSSMQPNAVDLAGQRSGSKDVQPPAFSQPRRVSKLQSAASGERRDSLQSQNVYFVPETSSLHWKYIGETSGDSQHAFYIVQMF